MVSHADYNSKSGTVAEEGGVSFQEHAEFWGFFFNPTESSVEACGGVVY